MLQSNPYSLQTYTAGTNGTFGNHLSNELRLNYSSNVTSNVNTIDAFGGSEPVNMAQLAGIDTAHSAVGVYFQLGPNSLNIGPQTASGAQKQWNLVDTAHVIQGRHQFSFGMDFRRLAPYAVPFNPSLFYSFSSESDVENNTNGFLGAQAFAPAHPLYKNFSLFAQDEWAVTQRLSLSFGLRWEVNPPPGVTRGQMPYTPLFQDPDPNNWTLAPQGTPLWKTTWFNFAPRLGLAYTFRNTPGWETVVRTGGGLFFDSGQQLGSIAFEGPGFQSARLDFPSSFPGNPVPRPCRCGNIFRRRSTALRQGLPSWPSSCAC